MALCTITLTLFVKAHILHIGTRPSHKVCRTKPWDYQRREKQHKLDLIYFKVFDNSFHPGQVGYANPFNKQCDSKRLRPRRRSSRRHSKRKNVVFGRLWQLFEKMRLRKGVGETDFPRFPANFDWNLPRRPGHGRTSKKQLWNLRRRFHAGRTAEPVADRN